MYLNQLSLQNFRNYSKSEFNFSKDTTLIVGSNASGNTNFLEAVFFLARGESFRTDKDEQVMRFGEEVSHLSAGILPISNTTNTTNNSIRLEIIIASGAMGSRGVGQKKYLVNGVNKRRVDFVGNLFTVLFSPLDLDMIVGSPRLRRNFLNSVLIATDIEYRTALLEFTKGLRQRNALLEKARETGRRDEKQFDYWDNTLIKSGQVIAQKREGLINFINSSQKDIFDFVMLYDKSVISKERLLQYKSAELGAGVTLVGPHRDDFNIQIHPNAISPNESESRDVKFFGSRGQQRLVVLQLKLFELEFVEKRLSERPILLLDDIFSELDDEHIKLVLEMIGKQQTIITTTRKEFVEDSFLKEASVIELHR
jgi:DNA replication and repair protein RecF